jgi:Fe-S-cluster containining protein
MAKQLIDIKKFKNKAYKRRKPLQLFLKKLHTKQPKGLDQLAKKMDDAVWNKIDCLSCANCCKTMTPTYKKADIIRISTFLNMTPKAFFDKWLMNDPDNKDVVNKTTPCQFLNKNNKCNIYEVRPADCSGFPHFRKKNIQDYTHVYSDNLHRCPATLEWTTLMHDALSSAK